MFKQKYLSVLSLLFITSYPVWAKNNVPVLINTAPIIDKQPNFTNWHDDLRLDDYEWLVHDAKAVKHGLIQEDAHANTILDLTLADTLIEEMKQRQVKQPKWEYWQHGKFVFKKSLVGMPKFYYQPKIENKSLPNAWRLLWQGDKQKSVMNFYDIKYPKINSTGTHVAIGYDTKGNENYQIAITSLNQTNQQITPIIFDNTNGDFVWLNDDTLLYVNQAGNEVLAYSLKTKQSTSIHKSHYGLYVSLSTASSDEYVFITINSQTSGEVWYLDKKVNRLIPTLFKARTPNVEYYLDHNKNGGFYLKTNGDRQGNSMPNFTFYQMNSLSDDELDKWQTVFTPKQNQSFESFFITGEWLIIKLKENGVTTLLYRPIENNSDSNQSNQSMWHKLELPKEHATVWLQSSGFSENLGEVNFGKDLLRVGYTSMTTPKTVLTYQLNTGQLLNKPSNLDYSVTSQRLIAKSKDNTPIPITLVYKKSQVGSTQLPQLIDRPLLVYGYGAYGHSLNPMYGTGYKSLLDRGFVYALVHVRGGGELGEAWHHAGQGLNKPNSFADFIAATQFLQKQGISTPQKTFAMGESAGGLLIANACVQASQLYRGCVLYMPLLDVLSPMLRKGVILPKSEYEEWGNPTNKHAYNIIKSYSPYEILTPKVYPNMLVIVGQEDVRSTPTEALKFVAKLRSMNESDNHVLLKVHDGGHKTGDGRMMNNALSYAFMLDILQQ